MADFVLKRNDTSPAIEYQLQDASGNAVDISGYNDIKFLMEDKSDSVVIDDNTSGNVSVTDAANGKVKYAWQSSDTDTAGYYTSEWEVEYSDGTIETFPNTEYVSVRIVEDIA